MKIPLKQLFGTKRPIVPKIRHTLFVGQYHCKGYRPRITEHTDIQILHHKLWDFFKVRYCSLTSDKKIIFPTYLDTKLFLAVNIANHHNKQVTP